MKRALRVVFLLAIASVAGWGIAELVQRSSLGDGIRAYFAGGAGEAAPAERSLVDASRGEPVVEADVDRELDILRHQFSDEKEFENALRSSGRSAASLRAKLASHLRERSWIEKKIAPQLNMTGQEAQEFYEGNREEFLQPQRYRVSHIFLAAPDGSAPEVMAEKQNASQGLAIRMLAGEDLAQLAAEASEDEATKTRGGDLGFFATPRMLPEFIAEVEKLAVGGSSAPIRTHLGFHILRLTESKLPHQMSFEEARPEILAALMNGKRTAAVAQLRDQLGRP